MQGTQVARAQPAERDAAGNKHVGHACRTNACPKRRQAGRGVAVQSRADEGREAWHGCADTGVSVCAGSPTDRC